MRAQKNARSTADVVLTAKNAPPHQKDAWLRRFAAKKAGVLMAKATVSSMRSAAPPLKIAKSWAIAG